MGFDPKGVIIWTHAPLTSDSDSTGDADGSLGFCDDADNNRCIGWVEDDNLATTDSKKTTRSTTVLFTINAGWSATMTLGTGKFTLTYTSNDSVASRIHWIAFGGSDITGVQCANANVSTSTGVQSISTDADCQSITAGQGVVFMVNNYDGGLNSVSNNMMPCIGFATKTTERGCIALGGDDANSIGEYWQMHRDDEVGVHMDSRDGSKDNVYDFDGFTSSGFDIDVTATGSSNAFIWMVIKGGKWQAGADTAKTGTTGTKATTTDFQPKGLIIANVEVTAEQNPTNQSGCWNVGADDGTNETSSGWSGEENADPTNVGIFSSSTKTVRIHDPSDQSVIAEAEHSAFGATSFTLNWTTVHASNAYRFLWLVCGDEAGGTALSNAKPTVSAIIG